MTTENGIAMKRILIVDDDEFCRDLLKDYLQGESYSIEEAVNGIEALSLMQDFSFDLIITDIMMPEMDGVELLIEMRERSINTKVIAISAGGNMHGINYLDIAKAYGVWGTLLKPFDGEELIALIKKILNWGSSTIPIQVQ